MVGAVGVGVGGGDDDRGRAPDDERNVRMRTEFRVHVFNVSDDTFDTYDAAVAAARRALLDGKHATLEERQIGGWRVIDVPFVTEEDFSKS
jgi:hypothetical protein